MRIFVIAVQRSVCEVVFVTYRHFDNGNNVIGKCVLSRQI